MHRPNEAAPSRNWGDDDAARRSAGRVPTGLSGRTAHGLHFISNEYPGGDVQHRARGRSKSNDATYRRPFERRVACAAGPACKRVVTRIKLPCFGAPASACSA
jgi:hypothetical protein